MKTKLISLSLALLLGVLAWADDIFNIKIYDDCSRNGLGIENGYTWVDLGLPSGLKWATCNVGAEKPEDVGNYYAWGEVLPKADYSLATYKYANGASEKLTKYCNKPNYGDNGFTDNKTTLEPEDDAAYFNWGGSWRMPTDAEWTELREQCTWTWTTQNGIYGYRVASKTNSNSIFLPAMLYFYDYVIGYYWSSSLNEDSPNGAWILGFDSGNVVGAKDERGNGLSVRPVCP